MSKLHQVYVMTPDIDRSRAFCEEILGLDVTYEGERSLEFETGACTLKFETDFDKDTLASFGMEPPGTRRGAGIVIVIETESVEAVHERAVSAGETVLQEPMEANWGRKMCLLESPAGYVFEISRPI